MTKSVPRVTVVMAVFNRVDVVGRAIDSVRSQTYGDLELVVVDGNSSDGTAELLRARQHEIDVLVIEPDHGIYDAWNKAIERVTGEWVLFLGSDDAYIDRRAVERLMAHLQSAPRETNLLTGRAVLVGANGRPGARIGGAWRRRHMSMFMTFAHPASATRRDLLEQHDCFALDIGIAADYDFYLRARDDVRAYDTGETTTLFSAAGVSNANRLATLRSTRDAQARDVRIGARRAAVHYACFHLAVPLRTAARSVRAPFARSGG